MEPFDYERGENFQTAINRAIESCETNGYTAGDHFRGVTKMIEIGSFSFFRRLTAERGLFLFWRDSAWRINKL